MKRIVLLLALVACVWCADSVLAQTRVPVWEVVQVDEESADATTDAIETEVRDGKVYIRVQHPVEVRVYSILGQLVTKRKLSAGTTALTLGSRGIYILKTDTVTRRINL